MITSDKVFIIGAGLCGSLLAIVLGRKGYDVEVYEKRPDMRKVHIDGGRSINLAFSDRGLMAMDRVGLKEKISKLFIPMKGRMVHPKNGDAFLSPYSGRGDDYINSVSREGLNILLMDEAERYDNVKFFFETPCVGVDIEKGEATFLKDDTKTTKEATVIFGTDGAGSVVRKSLMDNTTKLLFNYSQDFLRHGYKELTIYPTQEGKHRLEKNALHIWPRGAYMIIALPNLDGSFTVTMFHPFGTEIGFDHLDTDEKIQSFFEKEYSDLIRYMPDYLDQYHQNPVGTLGTIKCLPWQANGKVLILGDAAHAIVPFYGQGMICSFEDVRVLDDCMQDFNGDWDGLFRRVEDLRKINTDAIADLAIDNFYEMRDKVADPVFIKKRKLEMLLEKTYPDYYSKYSLVTFRPKLPYHKAMMRGRAQDRILLDACAKVENIHQIDTQAIYKKLMEIKI